MRALFALFIRWMHEREFTRRAAQYHKIPSTFPRPLLFPLRMKTSLVLLAFGLLAGCNTPPSIPNTWQPPQVVQGNSAKAIEGTEITNGTLYGGNMSVAGFTLPRTPKHSGAASTSVDLPLGASGLRFTSRLDVVYQSRRYAEIQNMIWAEPFTRINGSIGLKNKDWRVNLWVKNAANDGTSLNGFRYLDPVTFRRSAVDFLPKLRQYGLTAQYDF